MINYWRGSWTEFAPFLGFPAEVRLLIYTTNAISCLNLRFRVAARRRRHLPDVAAALKVIYPTVTQHRPDRANPTGPDAAWKDVLDVLVSYLGRPLGAQLAMPTDTRTPTNHPLTHWGDSVVCPDWTARWTCSLW